MRSISIHSTVSYDHSLASRGCYINDSPTDHTPIEDVYFNLK